MIPRNDQRLLERLSGYKDRFASIRQTFGLDDDIGFGSLPNAHDAYCMGVLLPVVSVKAKSPVYVCDDSLLPLFCEKFLFPLDEAARIIIGPRYSGKTPHLVSVYQKKSWWDRLEFEKKLLSVPDSVLDGLIAHEFSHWVKEHGALCSKARDALKVRESEYASFIKNPEMRARKHCADSYSIYTHWYHVFTNSEADIEIIASLYGFKDAVISKIEYMIDCLKRYKGPNSDSFYITPKQAIKQYKFRKMEVLKYC
jgi:hypothetical protein